MKNVPCFAGFSTKGEVIGLPLMTVTESGVLTVLEKTKNCESNTNTCSLWLDLPADWFNEEAVASVVVSVASQSETADVTLHRAHGLVCFVNQTRSYS
jgi:hypothetical protein